MIQDNHENSKQHGGETILIVDDDSSLLNVMKEVFSQFGYKTMTACSGQEALTLYHSQKEVIDLVILDWSMPGMDGCECSKRLLQIDPDSRILIASGDTNNSKIKETLELGVAGFLPKPCHIMDMVNKIRHVLNVT